MSLKLEVGKTYLNRYGDVIKIIHYNPDAEYYPYLGDNGVTYAKDGYYYTNCKSSYNLFTEHNPEDL